jgi:hypothetical protein
MSWLNSGDARNASQRIVPRACAFTYGFFWF